MAFARNQLPRGTDNERVGVQREFLPKRVAVRRLVESADVDRITDRHQAFRFDATIQQHVRNGVRYRNDFLKRPVTQRGNETHLGIVDTPRYHGGDVRETRRQPAQDIGAAATVTMHDIGLCFLEVLRQAIGKRQVEVAGAEQVLHTYAGLSCHVVDAGIRRTNQRIVVSAIAQGIDQVDDLLRPAQKMAPGFDMQYFHASMIL